ncbi:MAG: DUF167 domain-containing protein [Armatimonadetes bacterium]|nr:DUF167 domain-containing protein [Armatimonadota bacterium]
MRQETKFVSIRVRPRSSRAGLGLASDGTILVRVNAPANEGAANRACRELLAKVLGVPKSAVEIVRGQKSRAKDIAVVGLSASQVRARLKKAAGEGA